MTFHAATSLGGREFVAGAFAALAASPIPGSNKPQQNTHVANRHRTAIFLLSLNFISLTSGVFRISTEHQPAQLHREGDLLPFGITRAEFYALQSKRHRILFHFVQELRDPLRLPRTLHAALQSRVILLDPAIAGSPK